MTVAERSIYLSGYLSLLGPFLAREDVSDIYINRPGELWLEVNGGAPERHDVPGLSSETLLRLARQIAAWSSQAISREHPLLAASLPTGERIQIVVPPATRGHIAISIRRKIVSSIELENLRPRETEGSPVPLGYSKGVEGAGTEDIAELLRQAVKARKTILISGGTSSGKTTLLNTLIREIPRNERLIFIEDTPELDIRHDNAVGLVAPRSELRESEIDADDLLIASLRMRPDRIILGEIRGREAITFLRAVNTGHPGSISTIHANSCQAALDQLAFLAIQGGLKLGWDDLRKYIVSTVDLSINIFRNNGQINYSVINNCR
ncbi:P-type DNA transfer ATPase VirB11 [Sphingobium chlorophenolicum L-1]|uniref:Type IV secretion system protein n=1 Tax=Sphingobium chlorophenolicum L-1 TaxID=690566 RepID=F6EY64_SPHCR|nr:P-type DNA transfer ATPase VirB11 [Sphingobium chlorophenolicum]AEG49170.1 P-type DNA transfer ATPase VirB11 [Sphingobium chlorophenolicum L-1]